MTSPVTPLHVKGDQIILNGHQVTVLGWPALNVGPFFYEQADATGAITHATAYVEQSTITSTNAPALAPEDPADNVDDTESDNATGEDQS